ncbi:MAG: AI-2E family transporter [Chloroflexi bacterium]|nr:MAG: AI-2E family transporter [Chloroflexota bacterium]
MSERPPIQRWWVSYFVVGALAVVLVLVAFMLILTVLAPLSRVILLVMFGVIVAFLLAPLVELLQRPLRRRGLAIGLGATAALVVLIGGLALLAVPLVRETRELAEAAPRYAAMLSSDEPINVLGIEISGEVRERIGREIGDRASEWSEIAARSALRVAGGLVDVIFVLVLGVYLLASGPAVRRWLLDLVPADRRADAARVEDEGRRVFGSYIRGQLILGLIVGALSAIAYLALGVPYAVFLGVLAGVLELVPIVGPIVAGAAAALVALTQPFPLVLWVIAAAIAIQQIENHLLVPRISGQAVGLHPLAALLAVLVGVELAGLSGAIFAVPLTGLGWSLWRARARAA